MLIRALAGYAASAFLMAFANTVEQLFILRLIQGGVSGFIAATLAIVATTTPREKMGYAMGVLQTSLTTGAVSCRPGLWRVFGRLARYPPSFYFHVRFAVHRVFLG
ncbi:MAG: hypothetical protein KKH04_09640 [Proteobacteria bacterium]|nr:hypothetical protein [Pseudomonadota bacterium]